ncbi:MAG: ATP synthase F1 subunit gamma [Ignavibacteriae bacterium]|nr:ATP synthase F1 subunit gamma [Ignavibacteriota bacterium]
MATLKDIKRRIVGVTNTQQITKAMKMVAAARLRKAQENITNAKPYSLKLAEVLGHLLKSVSTSASPLFVPREVDESIVVVVLTSDKGLCGGFNMNVIRETEELITNKYKSLAYMGKVQMYCVGKKGSDYFSKRDNFNVVASHTGVFTKLKFDFAATLINELTTKFINKEIDKVIVVSNEFKSVASQNTVVQQLLPIPELKEDTEQEHKNIEYIYEPNQAEILNSLLPRHLKGQMWTMLLDSYAAELGARMTAMEMATENAKEMIKTLQVKYNKERQAAITTEILEIVSGANALKGA